MPLENNIVKKEVSEIKDKQEQKVKVLVKALTPESKKYSGKGTRARLNTAAEKNFFKSRSSA